MNTVCKVTGEDVTCENIQCTDNASCAYSNYCPYVSAGERICASCTTDTECGPGTCDVTVDSATVGACQPIDCTTGGSECDATTNYCPVPTDGSTQVCAYCLVAGDQCDAGYVCNTMTLDPNQGACEAGVTDCSTEQETTAGCSADQKCQADGESVTCVAVECTDASGCTTMYCPSVAEGEQQVCALCDDTSTCNLGYLCDTEATSATFGQCTEQATACDSSLDTCTELEVCSQVGETATCTAIACTSDNVDTQCTSNYCVNEGCAYCTAAGQCADGFVCDTETGIESPKGYCVAYTECTVAEAATCSIAEECVIDANNGQVACNAIPCTEASTCPTMYCPTATDATNICAVCTTDEECGVGMLCGTGDNAGICENGCSEPLSDDAS